MRILLAAGGTGGHVTPAIATAEAIVEALPSASVLFVADGRPVAEKFFSRVGFGREHLFPRHKTAPKLREVFAWIAAYRRARAVLRDFEPDVVVGFGGYPTMILGVAALGVPPAACLRFIASSRAPVPHFPSRAPKRPPIVLLEQNARPGRSVRFLRRVCDRVLLSFEDARAFLSEDGVELTGNPLPRTFLGESTDARPEEFGLVPGKTTLLVLGGSQGARGVNRLLLATRAELGRRFPDLQILFIAGDLDFESVKQEVATTPGPPTVVLPFEHRMRRAYETADLVVCRAGGTTLAELAIIGRPMVVVPYPYHQDRHQLRNAEVFARVGAASIVEEGAGAENTFLEAVSRWLGDRGARDRASIAARTLGHPGAAATAARRILEIGGYSGPWN